MISDLEIGWMVDAIRENPEECRVLVDRENASRVIKKLAEIGSMDSCLSVIKAFDSDRRGLGYTFDNWPHLVSLLDEMVHSDYYVDELVNQTIDRRGAFHYLFRNHNTFISDHLSDLSDGDQYWRSLFDYEISRRDTKRAWDTIVDAFRGFRFNGSKYFSSNLHTIKVMVDTLYDLMIKKGKLKKTNLVPGGLPEHVMYQVKEKRKSRADRFLRVRRARSYGLRGYAPGHHIASRFLLPNTQVIDITGQKILTIASYFSKKKHIRDD